MIRQASLRLAIAVLHRCVAGNEPLVGDLLEASRTRSAWWLWREVLVAVALAAMRPLREPMRVTWEASLLYLAMLMLLGFHAVVAATLVQRVLVMADGRTGTMATGAYAPWRLHAAIAFSVVAFAIGRAIGRFHRTRRLAAVLAFSAAATLAAFLDLHFFIPQAGPELAFMPRGAVQIGTAMVFVAALFLGVASRPLRRGGDVIVMAALIAAVALPPAEIQAQSPAEAPAFEAASVRRNVTWDQPGSGLSAPQPGGRYMAIGVTLRRLVEDAYGLEAIGGPAWADSERFDVDATAGADAASDRIRLMLRALLADRFGLEVHTERRETAVFALLHARPDGALAPGGRESDPTCAADARNGFPSAQLGFPPACGDFRAGANTLVARAMTMEGLAGWLSGRVGRPVLNQTRLNGAYDLEIEWSSDGGLTAVPADSAGSAELRPDGVTLFTALQEQLGLRLEPTRAPVGVLVIDRAERPAP